VSSHFVDRLLDAIRRKEVAACVGLDPLIDRLPVVITGGQKSISSAGQAGQADMIRRYCLDVLDVVAPLVPSVKINIAFFEPFHSAGVAAYYDVVQQAAQAGLVVIGDVKRGDIGHSTAQYAVAHLSAAGPGGDGGAVPDAVTVSPYLGFDSIKPFAQIAQDESKGLFVLVQTSNESAEAVQGLELADGRKLVEEMGRLVESWAADPALVGQNGYSCIGAVVSPRDLASTDRLRTLMPHCFYLVPGFGAQGRTAQEVAYCFKKDGTGAIVNASRSVIYAYEKPAYRADFGDDWKRCVERGCRDFAHQIRSLAR